MNSSDEAIEKSWPRTRKEAAEKLIGMLPYKDKLKLQAMSKFDLILLHHGFGTFIRNNFGLWGGNAELMEECGAFHPDDASMIIIEDLWVEIQNLHIPRLKTMKLKWEFTEKDVESIREFVETQRENPFVKYRIRMNVDGPSKIIDEAYLWERMVACLLSSQQQSGPQSATTRFICRKPFPLSLEGCRKADDFETEIKGRLPSGIRFGPTIASRLTKNLQTLEDGGWEELLSYTNRLRENRMRLPQISDKHIEREAAVFVDNLEGFGPKQSRNLWQMAGLSRFEIPLDSRITNWLNENGFPIHLTSTALSDGSYYNLMLDGVQELCSAANIYPCILDAAIFASSDKPWPEEILNGEYAV